MYFLLFDDKHNELQNITICYDSENIRQTALAPRIKYSRFGFEKRNVKTRVKSTSGNKS